MERKRRPNKIVYVNGNAFHTRRTSTKANTRYLRCTYYNKTGCKASAKMHLNDPEGKITLMYSKHNHTLDLKAEFKRALKIEICKGFGSYRDIYEDVSQRFPGAAQLCPFNSIKAALYRWKHTSPSNIENYSSSELKTNSKANEENTKIENWNENNFGTITISEFKNLCDSSNLDYSIAELDDDFMSSEVEIPPIIIANEQEKNNTSATNTESDQKVKDLFVIVYELKKQIENLKSNVSTLCNQVAEEKTERLILQNTVEKVFGDSYIREDIFFNSP